MVDNKVVEYFRYIGLENKIHEFDSSCATVSLAAKSLGIEEARIAKTLAFSIDGRYILIVAAGDVKIDNAKYRQIFNCKASMIARQDLEEKIGFTAGSVCPFCLKQGVEVYLDKSLLRFDTVYPACGKANNTIELSIKQLEENSNYISWIDVCKSVV